MLRKKVFLLVFVAVGLFSSISLADEFHYNNVLVGDRASGMGGAYSAISDDATGLYYNPAGVAYATGKNLSASVNAFYSQTKTYDGVIGGNGWTRKSSALLPNYFGIVQPLGKFKFGFSYAVPDSNKEDQDQTFYNLALTTDLQAKNPGVTISSYTINFNNDDNTYQLGPTIAGEVFKDFSAGITLYVHQRTVQRTLNQFIAFSNTGSEWINNYYEMNETGVRPILGLAWSPVEKVSLALAVSKVIVLNSQRTIQQTYGLDNLNTDSIAGADNIKPLPVWDRRDTKKKYPVQTTAGIAYFPSRNLLFSLDVSYFSAVDKVNDPALADDPAFGEREAVLNIALGTEYFLDKSWALRGGLFTNMANTPDIQAGTTSIEEHIDIYGGSLSISHFTRNTAVTLGGSLSSGSGKSQITGNPAQVQDASTLGWTISLSSSYSY